MIVITGATGQLGRAITERLLAHVPPQRVAVSVRDPRKADDLAERGVRVRAGDFGEPGSLAHAFEGAEQVLVVAISSTGEARVRMHGAAIEAAVASGARRVLYTSHMGARPESPFLPMPDHYATEGHLRDSGIAYTALRNGFYASTTAMLVGRALESGVLAAPQDGPVSWTAHADLAEVAAIALAKEPSALDGVTPPLTAGEAVDLSAVAAIASDLTDRPIERVVIDDGEYHAMMVANGAPPHAADMLIGMFRASRAGEFSATGPTLERLLGRRPTPVGEVLAAALPGGAA